MIKSPSRLTVTRHDEIGVPFQADRPPANNSSLWSERIIFVLGVRSPNVSNSSPAVRGWFRLPLFPWWVRGLLVLVTIGVLLYYSIVPAPGTGSISSGPFGILSYSMWLHIIGYMGLAIVLAYATAHIALPRWQVLGAVFVVVMACGMAVEVVQYFLPGRTFSVMDMLVNAVGAAIGLFIWAILERSVQFYRVR